MSLKVKLAAAFAVSIVLLGGLLYFFVFRPEAPEKAPPLAEPGPVAEAPAPKAIDPPAAKPALEKKEAPAGKREAERAAASSAVVGTGRGWTMIGRIVREGAPGEASGPVAGAAVHLKPHPRLVRPEAAPKPARVVTGADGKFELIGVPGEVWLRLEIDEPSSAYRTLSFQLNAPEPDPTIDL